MTIKIIDGKRYNTETATLVAEWANTYDYGDFKHCEEDLYLTPKGAWFTLGSGGPLSKYARSTGQNSWSGSRDVITPMSPDEARAWLEDHGETEALEKHFAASIKDA